ncbi:MAG: glutamate--tRNA ligase [Acidimicrobiia bacterium]
MAPRVRFSPAPSGRLHVGGARTALFNWLFARHEGGVMLLRVEDTDASRSREEWVDAIGDTLQWFGLDWDEAPWRQSQRLDEYLAAADALVAAGHAYECFETPEELEAIHAERKAAGLPPGYDGRSRDLSAEERVRLAAEGRPRTIWFRTPDEGRSTFSDVVRGEVSVEWSTVSDFVIVRSDGSPLFFLANAVDDIAMGITHVIRGEDLIDTTHRVLAIRRALGSTEQPVYAHLPLILQADRSKLGKRHGAVAVEDFRERGILAEALLNYLALLGWAPDDDREVMTREEIVAAFSLERVTPSAAIFDDKKLEWLNGEWIRRIPLDDLVARLRPFVAARAVALPDDVLQAAAAIGQERATTLVSLAEQMDFLGAGGDFRVADDVWDAVVPTVPDPGALLDAVTSHVEDCAWTVDGVKGMLDVIKGIGLKPGKVMKLVYAAVEGRAAGLPLFDSVVLLGRDETLRRLRRARSRLD